MFWAKNIKASETLTRANARPTEGHAHVVNLVVTANDIHVSGEMLISICNAFNTSPSSSFCLSCYAIYYTLSTPYPSPTLSFPPWKSAAVYAHPATAFRFIESFSTSLAVHKILPTLTLTIAGQRSFHSRLAILSTPRLDRGFCTSSADRAPRHGNHDVRSHGLDQGNGTVDGLGPSEMLLVEFGEAR